MMTIGAQDVSTLEEGEFFGYPVDAGMGCFADQATAALLDERLRADKNQDFADTIIMEVHKTGWMKMEIGDGNLIMFQSGYGDGVYPTYAGFDVDGELAAIVTDFGVAFEDEDDAYDDDDE